MTSAAAPAAAPVSVSAAQAAALTAAIRARAGIVVQDHQVDAFRAAAAAACRQFGVADAVALLDRLTKVARDAPEWEFLISRVTIGESYFFRDEGQIAFIRDVWLARIAEAKRRAGDRTLRIWCAGCANGQEPYTLAMLLQDGLLDLAKWDVRILATDINAEALRAAVEGRFSAWSFRATAPDVRDRFFFRDGKDYVLNDRTRALVDFAYLNLVGDPFPSLTNHTAGLDLILCRNVFIYFDRPTVNAVMEKFARCLHDGGHILVGASDPVALENKGLVYHHGALTGYFRRGDETAAPTPPAPVAARRPAKPSAPPVPAPARAPIPVSGMDGVLHSIRAADWAGALARITAMEVTGQEPEDGLRLARAKVLANMGRLEDAMAECVALIAAGNTDKHTFYLLGLIETDQGDRRAAAAAFRRALFLDRAFVEAHYQLGLIEFHAGNAAAGEKHFRNALALAEAAPADQHLHEAGDMTMGRLVAVLRHSLFGDGEGAP